MSFVGLWVPLWTCEVADGVVSRCGVRATVVLGLAARGGGGKGGGRRGGGRSGEKFSGGLRDDQGGRRRPSRVSELLRRELSEIVRECIASAPRSAGLGNTLVSVLGVRISDDLKNATVSVSIFNDPNCMGDALAYLKRARKTIRMRLSQQMREMKYIPDLRFSETDVGAGFQTLEILNRLSKERQDRGETEDITMDSESADSDLDMDLYEDETEEKSVIFGNDKDDDDDEGDEDDDRGSLNASKEPLAR